MDVTPLHRSAIDPGLVPAALWTRDYLRRCNLTGGSTELTIALRREDGTASLFRTRVLASGVDDTATYLHVERTVKFLLWSRGASDILLCGHEAAGLVLRLQADYSPKGCRAFDADFFRKAFERPSPPPPICPSAATWKAAASASISAAPIGSAPPSSTAR